jgi:hypothetical protein
VPEARRGVGVKHTAAATAAEVVVVVAKEQANVARTRKA